MIEWVLILFTQMDPHVEGKITEATVVDCQAWVEENRPKWEAVEGLTFTMRCEKRRKPKETEVAE